VSKANSPHFDSLQQLSSIPSCFTPLTCQQGADARTECHPCLPSGQPTLQHYDTIAQILGKDETAYQAHAVGCNPFTVTHRKEQMSTSAVGADEGPFAFHSDLSSIPTENIALSHEDSRNFVETYQDAFSIGSDVNSAQETVRFSNIPIFAPTPAPASRNVHVLQVDQINGPYFSDGAYESIPRPSLRYSYRERLAAVDADQVSRYASVSDRSVFMQGSQSGLVSLSPTLEKKRKTDRTVAAGSYARDSGQRQYEQSILHTGEASHTRGSLKRHSMATRYRGRVCRHTPL